jgi:hypothetical protein
MNHEITRMSTTSANRKSQRLLFANFTLHLTGNTIREIIYHIPSVKMQKSMSNAAAPSSFLYPSNFVISSE